MVEFGHPMNFHHRMVFTYHKLVYNIAGQLYSINEITYGILKGPMPLPHVYNETSLSTSSNSGIHSGSISSIAKKSGSEITVV